MAGINVGSVLVDVLPDMGRFRPEVDRVVRDLPTFQIDIGADTTQARAAIEELGRAHSATINVNVDDALAAARLDELSRDRTADLTIRERHVSDGGGGGIGLLGAGILASPLAVPLGAAGLAGGAGLAAGALAGGAGLGALVLGLSGVKTAVDAVTKAHAGSGAAAVASGIAQANAAAAVQGAQASLTNAIASAANQQITAEQNLAAAQQSEQLAQQNLTLAREQAKQQMQDLTLSVQDGALAQRQATLNVIAAHKALERVQLNVASTELQRQQAKLTYDQAVQQVTDIGVRQSRLQAQQKAASKAGVEGSTQVTSAQRAVAAAAQGVENAVRAQANTARQSAASVAAAQLAFQNAQRGAAVAAQQTTSASKTAATALAALSPAGRKFAEFVIGSLEPALKKIKDAAAGGVLPGLQSGLSDLLPVLPQISTLVGSVAAAVGDLFAAAGKALSSPFFKSFFKDLAASIGPSVKTMGEIFGNLATAFAGLFQAFLPVAKSMGDGLVGLTGQFADFATHLGTNAGFQSFLAYVKTEGPKVAEAIGNIFVAVGHLLVGLAPLGAVMLTVIGYVAKILAQLSPGQLIAVLAGATTGVALLMAAFDATPIGLVVTAVALFAAGLVYAWDHSKTFKTVVLTAFQLLSIGLLEIIKGILSGIDLFARISDAVFGTHLHKSVQGAIDNIDRLVDKIKHIGDSPPSIVIPVRLDLNPALHTAGFIGPTIAESLAQQGIAGPYTPLQTGGTATGSVSSHRPDGAGLRRSPTDSLAASLGAQSGRNLTAAPGSGAGSHIELNQTIINPVPETVPVSTAHQLRRLAFTLGAVT
jgi:hypothetical protein